MLKSMQVAVLGLITTSLTFSVIPPASAFVSTPGNESITTTEINDNPLLFARTYRYRVRRVYRRPRRVRVRGYSRCYYRYRYYRGSRYRYRVCKVYRR